MTLISDLHSIIPHPCHDRPFVCDGLPQSCTVLVVGENPATNMDTNWWSYWSDETGFNLSKFEYDYEARRRAQGKRAVSPTRERLKRLRSRGLQCLETNVFAQEGLGGHGAGQSNIELLRLFLSKLPQLNAIIAHGAEANREIDRIELPAWLHLFSTRHFRLVSYDKIYDIAAQIAKLPPRQPAAS